MEFSLRSLAALNLGSFLRFSFLSDRDSKSSGAGTGGRTREERTHTEGHTRACRPDAPIYACKYTKQKKQLYNAKGEAEMEKGEEGGAISHPSTHSNAVSLSTTLPHAHTPSLSLSFSHSLHEEHGHSFLKVWAALDLISSLISEPSVCCGELHHREQYSTLL